MTQKEAKELSLELWTYLAEYPEITNKLQLPDRIYSKVKNYYNECPLCEVFFTPPCRGCPLNRAGEKCTKVGSAWRKWFWPGSGTKTRREEAERIVQIISAWEPEAAS
jgi:hypothetical protein